jgi:hypothetical protein
MVGVLVNPGGMIGFSFAMFAAVGVQLLRTAILGLTPFSR